MPVYEYQCPKCDKVFEVTQKISDPPLEKPPEGECPEGKVCSEKPKKLISGGTSFLLKGSGWAKDGY